MLNSLGVLLWKGKALLNHFKSIKVLNYPAQHFKIFFKKLRSLLAPPHWGIRGPFLIACRNVRNR